MWVFHKKLILIAYQKLLYVIENMIGLINNKTLFNKTNILTYLIVTYNVFYLSIYQYLLKDKY